MFGVKFFIVLATIIIYYFPHYFNYRFIENGMDEYNFWGITLNTLLSLFLIFFYPFENFSGFLALTFNLLLIIEAFVFAFVLFFIWFAVLIDIYLHFNFKQFSSDIKNKKIKQKTKAKLNKLKKLNENNLLTKRERNVFYQLSCNLEKENYNFLKKKIKKV